MRTEELRAIHDLRMPAQMMTGCAEMLKCILQEQNAEAQRYLALLTQNGEKLVSLLDQLTEARHRAAEEPRMHMTVGDMAAATSEICEMAEPYARSIGLNLICIRPNHAVITAFDGERFTRILMNLLSNAMKFTPGGGRIAVRLETQEGEIRLSVSDTGIGMPDHELRTLLTESGGVGLSIVQQYARLHGGRVTAERNLRGGMCFTVIFPMHADFSAERPLPVSAASLASGAGFE